MLSEKPTKPAGETQPSTEVPAVESSQTPTATHSRDSACPIGELRTKLIELEYEYLTQSSFHTDHLRNQFIQFYLLIVGVAATAIVGLAQMQADAQQAGGASPVAPLWAFSGIAFFIGAVGLVMIPIFARLRRIVLECLQGTVLLKRYTEELVGQSGDELFASALLWDASSLPTDEYYLTASFLLVFVFMLLDSAMFTLGILLVLSESLSAPAVGLESLAVGTGLLTLQVILYRCLVWREIRKARASDRLEEKWGELEIGAEVSPPSLWSPVVQALLVGGTLTTLLALAAF